MAHIQCHNCKTELPEGSHYTGSICPVCSARAVMPPPHSTATPAAQVSAPTSDFEQQLRKLAKLRDDGILSQHEFDEKKSTILWPTTGSDTPSTRRNSQESVHEGLSPRTKGWLIAGGLLLLLLIMGSWTAEEPDQGSSTGGTRPAISKFEWKQQHSRLIGMRGGRAALIRSLGAPDQTQTVGNSEFWSYQCSDGVIQLDIGNPSHGDFDLVVFQVNDY